MQITSTSSIAAFEQIPEAQTGSFGIRAGARIIDWVAGIVAASVAGAAAGLILSMLNPDESAMYLAMPRVFGNFLWALVAVVASEIVSESIGGCTLGKLILGYRVVTTDLQPCTPLAAAIRSGAYFIDSFFFGVVGYVAMSKASHNQRYGDQWAGTIVAKASAVPEQARRPQQMAIIGVVAGFATHALVIMTFTLLGRF